ncbi:MAG: ABC transporter substrate-binding protein [Desulfobacter sp.]|nr:MAG: ABC transporter substrate-binding protein [Desulfobacter sp.]
MVGSALLPSSALPGSGPPESPAPIAIVTNDWTSQNILSRIAGRIFQSMGYNIAYFRHTDEGQWGLMLRGHLHVQVEVWEGTNAKLFARMLKQGGVIDAGTYTAITREDWWYPDYVEGLCPGLPDWRALETCYPVFATDLTRPLGQYIGGPWDQRDRARISALGLKFKMVKVQGGSDWNQTVSEVLKKHQPIIFFNWTPNWVEAEVPGKFVEFPGYEKDCETRPEWGVNPDFLFDCGNPRRGWLKKAAWAGMPEQWPCAFQTLKRMDFGNAEISRLVHEVDIQGISVEKTASRWLDANKKLWQSWIPPRCRTEND